MIVNYENILIFFFSFEMKTNTCTFLFTAFSKCYLTWIFQPSKLQKHDFFYLHTISLYLLDALSTKVLKICNRDRTKRANVALRGGPLENLR